MRELILHHKNMIRMTLNLLLFQKFLEIMKFYPLDHYSCQHLDLHQQIWSKWSIPSPVELPLMSLKRQSTSADFSPHKTQTSNTTSENNKLSQWSGSDFVPSVLGSGIWISDKNFRLRQKSQISFPPTDYVPSDQGFFPSFSVFKSQIPDPRSGVRHDPEL